MNAHWPTLFQRQIFNPINRTGLFIRVQILFQISFQNFKGQKSYRKFLGVRSELLLSIYCIFYIFTRLSENIKFNIFTLAAPVAVWVRSLYFSALNHSINSPLCLVKVRAPHWPHVRQAKFYLWVCQVVFPGYSRFAPHIDRLVSMSEIILKGTVN